MQLSKDAVSILKWMRKHKSWKYRYEIEAKCPHFSRRAFTALETAGCIDSCEFEDRVIDLDDSGRPVVLYLYQISDTGKAHLETLSATFRIELRSWIAIAISLAALAVSIITAALK